MTPLKNQKKKVQKALISWWNAPFCLIFFTLFLGSIDAANLYNIINYIFTNDQILVIFVTLGLALSLNIIPVIMAKCIQCYQITQNRSYIALSAVLLFVGLSLFGLTFDLRYENRCADISDTSLVVSSSEEYTENLSEQEEAQILAATFVLGFLPLGTSTICFVLAYYDNGLKRKRNTIELEIVDHNEAIVEIDAAVTELQNLIYVYEDHLKERQLKLYESAKNEAEATANLLKSEARFRLAEHLKDPESISTLSKV